MLANDKPLCGDEYSLDDFCNPCGRWESPVDILPRNDIAPVVTAAAAAERPGKRALTIEDEYLDLTPPKRRKLTPAAA